MPFRNNSPGYEFQQDNARAHMARTTQDSLRNNGIPVMNWPAL